jgi:hypothetical protein
MLFYVGYYAWEAAYKLGLVCTSYIVRRFLLYRCGASPETLLHILQDCLLAKHVWHKLRLDFQNGTYDDDLHLWFKMYAIGQQNTFFLIGCWFIWKSIYEEVFSDINHPFWYILSQIYYHYNSTKKVFCGPSSILFFYVERNRILCWLIACMKETLVQIS